MCLILTKNGLALKLEGDLVVPVTHALYRPGSLSLYAHLHPLTGCCMFGGETPEQLREKYPDIRLLPIDEAMRLLEQTQQQELEHGPRPIDITAYQEALECLPPVRWTRVDGVESFILSEALCADYYSIYARIDEDAYRITGQPTKWTPAHIALQVRAVRTATANQGIPCLTP